MAYCEEHGIEVDMKRGKKSPILWTPTFCTSATKVEFRRPCERERRRHVALVGQPENAPDEARYIEIGFQNGDPVTLDGKALARGHAGNPE